MNNLLQREERHFKAGIGEILDLQYKLYQHILQFSRCLNA